MTEVWKNCPGADGYEVSDQGRVRRMKPDGHRAKRGYLIKICVNRSGYSYFRPSVDGRAFCVRINRAVCEAFNGPPFVGAEAAHNNGISSDNRAANLRWATPCENAADRILHGTSKRGVLNPSAKLSEAAVREIRCRPHYFGVCRDLSAEFGVGASYISRIRRGLVWPDIASATAASHVDRGCVPRLAEAFRHNQVPTMQERAR